MKAQARHTLTRAEQAIRDAADEAAMAEQYACDAQSATATDEAELAAGYAADAQKNADKALMLITELRKELV